MRSISLPSVRATKSAAPPAGHGTTIVTGRLGKVWLQTSPLAKQAPDSNKVRRTIKMACTR
jgi:hypothetical protein